MRIEPNEHFSTFPQRLMAFNIDMTIFLFTVVPFSLLIENDLWFMVFFVFAICIYHAGMESSDWQSTLGKRYSKMKVVNEDGEQISFTQGMIRIVVKFLSLLLLFGGFFMIYFRKDRRGLHDILAKTYVIGR